MPVLIRAKRVCKPYDPGDGTRVLVERLWPRGFTREKLHADSWLRNTTPTAEPRTWYAHDVTKWSEFVTRYTAQLDTQPDLVASLLETARHGPLTLLFAAKDPDHSSAVVLLNYLEKRLAVKERPA